MFRGVVPHRFSRMRALIGGLLLFACLGTTLLVAQPGHAAGTEQGPVAAYSFDEGTGTTVEDVTGDGHTATIEGAKWARGRYGDGLEFKGSEHNVVKIPASSELNFEEEFTLEAWVRPTSSTDKLAPIVGKTTGGGSGSKSLSYYLYAGNSESKPYGEVQHVLGTGKKASATNVPPGATWTHLTLTYDGAVERLFVNGVQVAETATEAPVTTTGELQIGAETEHSEYFSGRIDEVRIYNRALNGAEVGSDMEAPLITPKQGPVAAYSFDEGTGTTVEDVTGDGHTATIEDGEWAKGKYGGGIGFDGSGGNKCVSVADSPELRFSEEFTLEAWIRPEGTAEEDPVVVRESSGKDAFGLGLGSREEGEAEGFIGEGSGSKAAVGGEEIREYEWVHLAATWDGSKIRLYVDGELADTETATSPPAIGEGSLKIGCDGPDGQFTGQIDEVRVYNRTLTGGEVAADMETSLQTPKATPVAAYSFDEGTGTTVEDLTGDGHTATIEGAKWTTHGQSGGAVEFEAAKKAVLKIPASPELDFDGEFTLEAWVRPSSASNKEAPLIDKQEGKGLGYALYEGGSVSDRPEAAASEGQEIIHATEPLPANAWSHVALVFDGNRTYLYVDGELVDNGAAEPTITSEGQLEIGGSTDTSDWFDGRIDEVRIYNRALDHAEVGSDMEAPIQTPKKGPVAAWSFDEGTGTTVEDVTGNGHTATIEGAGWVRGKYGDALHFDGEDDCVSIEESEDLRFDEEFTLEAWVRPDAGSPSQEPIITQEDEAAAEGEEPYAYALVGGGEASPAGWVRITGEHEYEGIYGDGPMPEDVWSHIALTDDGGDLRLYQGGELVRTVPAPVLTAAHGQLTIGCDKTFGAYFKGRIDEVRIYNRALNEAEVAAGMGPFPYASTAGVAGAEAGEAVLSAMVNPGGAETHYRFEYGLTSAYGASAPESPEVSEEVIDGNTPVEVEEVIDGLKPDTTYHYRASAFNSLGTMVGQDREFKTPSDPTPQEKLTEERHELRTTKKGNGFFDINWNGNPTKTANEETAKMVFASGSKMFRVVVNGVSTDNDHLFQFAAQRGVTLLPDIVGVPTSPDGHLIPRLDRKNAQGHTYQEEWETKLTAIVSRYGQGGSFWAEHPALKGIGLEPEWWEIWNEPNFGPTGSEGPDGTGEANPTRYGELLGLAHATIQGVDPGAKILVGGLLTVGSEGIFPHMSVQEFISKMKHESDYNAVSLHPYAFQGLQKGAKLKGETPVEHVTKLVRHNVKKARAALDNRPGGTAKKLWITEIGWPVKGHQATEDNSHRLVEPEVQKQLLNSVFGMLKEYSGTASGSFNIKSVFYYNLQDDTEPGATSTPHHWDSHCGLREDTSGLGEGGKYRKEAWTAFQAQSEAPEVGAEP
jgi:Concanavalin A-like lectin/glucanases superfamily